MLYALAPEQVHSCFGATTNSSLDEKMNPERKKLARCATRSKPSDVTLKEITLVLISTELRRRCNRQIDFSIRRMRNVEGRSPSDNRLRDTSAFYFPNSCRTTTVSSDPSGITLAPASTRGFDSTAQLRVFAPVRVWVKRRRATGTELVALAK